MRKMNWFGWIYAPLLFLSAHFLSLFLVRSKRPSTMASIGFLVRTCIRTICFSTYSLVRRALGQRETLTADIFLSSVHFDCFLSKMTGQIWAQLAVRFRREQRMGEVEDEICLRLKKYKLNVDEVLPEIDKFDWISIPKWFPFSICVRPP